MSWLCKETMPACLTENIGVLISFRNLFGLIMVNLTSVSVLTIVTLGWRRRLVVLVWDRLVRPIIILQRQVLMMGTIVESLDIIYTISIRSRDIKSISLFDIVMVLNNKTVPF